ncbi:50S ribosomal protein L10 [bacterium]|nr:50S ribosomal protein L10 [bacterium]
MNLKQKEQKIDNYAAALESAGYAIMTEFGKTKATTVEAFRRDLNAIGCQTIVMKNTLARIVFERHGVEEMTEYLVGPTMMFYGEEEIATAAKMVQKLGKAHKALKVKAILFDGKVYAGKDFASFTALPTKQEIRAKFAGVIKAPIAQFVRVINTPQRIATVLKAYADKRG